MPTFQKCDPSVKKLADEILKEFDSYEKLRAAEPRIDFLFAYPDYDENDQPTNDAIKHQGVKALGLCRIVNLKDRTKGLGDAEILLDGDWWKGASDEEQKALLDHELHHLAYVDKRDNLGRPKLKLRKHDFQFGWFTLIASRHGVHSQERIQAASMMEMAGQYFWPEVANAQDVYAGRATRLEIKTKA